MGANSSRERISQEVDIKLLRKEVDSLKQDNDSLRQMLKHEISAKRDRCDVPQHGLSRSVVSNEVANEVVEEMLADPDSNLSFVPDFLERQMEQQAIMYLFH